jgi:hypothetical protein
MSLDDNLDALRNRLRNPGGYQTASSYELSIPKGNFTLRPGVFLDIEDRIVYQAIADYLAPHFAPEDCVYSNRLAAPDSNTMFIPGVDLWLQFQDRQEELCLEHSHFVRTDIASYFDHIGHDLMRSRLRDVFGHSVPHEDLEQAIIVLIRMWRRWAQGRRYGIPQMLNPSSLFANVFLDELDKHMTRRGFPFLRYVDDMTIFANSEAQARKRLAYLVNYLRRMQLYVSSAKTRIGEGADFIEELNTRRDIVTSIQDGLTSRQLDQIEAAAAQLESFFLEMVENEEQFDDRLFRYCVNRFRLLRVSKIAPETSERVVAEVLLRLSTMPSSTDVFIGYLSLFPASESLQSQVCHFLESEYNIYEWQEALLLELLLRSDISPQLHDRVRGLARDIAVTGHPSCRAKAVMLWGKIGDYQDRRDIRAQYYAEEHEEVKRCILYAIQEMQAGERNHFYESEVPNDSRGQQRIVEYVRRLDEPRYHYFNPPRGYDWDDILEWDDMDSEDFLS